MHVPPRDAGRVAGGRGLADATRRWPPRASYHGSEDSTTAHGVPRVQSNSMGGSRSAIVKGAALDTSHVMR